MAERRARLPFLIALFAAPALFGAMIWAFGLMGDYASRFTLAGTLGMLAVLPTWFTAYPWLAWRDPPAPGMKPRVKAALAANFASLVIFPALVVLLYAVGSYDALLSEGAGDGIVGSDPLDVPPPRDVAMWAAMVSFMLGLVFLPVFAALFSWIERKLQPRA